MKRYYPSTRERITRAFNEGVKRGGYSPYSDRNSGRALNDAWIRGAWSRHGFRFGSPLPVVDLSAEFADVIAEVEADPPKCLGRAS